MYERSFVGLDVHARSVVACGIDTVTGEVTRARLTPILRRSGRGFWGWTTRSRWRMRQARRGSGWRGS